jgi:hypothetical protein
MQGVSGRHSALNTNAQLRQLCLCSRSIHRLWLKGFWLWRWLTPLVALICLHTRMQPPSIYTLGTQATSTLSRWPSLCLLNGRIPPILPFHAHPMLSPADCAHMCSHPHQTRLSDQRFRGKHKAHHDRPIATRKTGALGAPPGGTRGRAASPRPERPEPPMLPSYWSGTASPATPPVLAWGTCRPPPTPLEPCSGLLATDPLAHALSLFISPPQIGVQACALIRRPSTTSNIVIFDLLEM